jgi:hypothetical protein
VELDKGQQFEEALALYRTGLEYLHVVIQYEKSGPLKQTLTDIVSASFFSLHGDIHTDCFSTRVCCGLILIRCGCIKALPCALT